MISSLPGDGKITHMTGKACLKKRAVKKKKKKKKNILKLQSDIFSLAVPDSGASVEAALMAQS